MTLIYEASGSVPDPGTHALIIGVGQYDFLDHGECARAKNAMELGQLSSPPCSARALADWLLGIGERTPGLRNPDAPLASVELLLSPNKPCRNSDGLCGIEEATFDNILRAFDRWYQRSNSSEGNVALFYFCGHGLEKADLALLPQDFWKYEGNAWATAVNFHATYRGMAECKARTQCYFVDACRQVVPPVLEDLDFSPQPLKTGSVYCQSGVRTAPIFYAAADGRQAFGTSGEVSRFTSALLSALKGGAGDKRQQNRWVISTDSLSRAIRPILQRNNSGLRSNQRQYSAVGGDYAGLDKILHHLSDRPIVPATVYCEPSQANRYAHFWLTERPTGQSYRREPAPDSWTVLVPAGIYDVGAEFQTSSFRSDRILYEWVLPPHYEAAVEVSNG